MSGLNCYYFLCKNIVLYPIKYMMTDVESISTPQGGRNTREIQYKRIEMRYRMRDTWYPPARKYKEETEKRRDNIVHFHKLS
jgi:hypothetical protein